MARILLHDDHDHELAPYCCPTGARTLLPTDKTSRRYACDTNPITCSCRYAYEPDKSSCRYAYDLTSLAPIYPANRQVSCRYAYEPDNLLVPICLREYPDKSSCRYAYDPDNCCN